MSTFNATEAYKFELYETVLVPKEVPAEEKKSIKLKEYKSEDVKDKIVETNHELKKNNHIVRLIVVSLLAFLSLALLIASQTKISVIALDEDVAITELSQQDSERVRLETALAQKVPMNEVEKYAVEKLGMVKATRSQIIYINMNRVADKNIS